MKMVAHVVATGLAAFIIYTAWPGSSLFSWHPACMALAFICLMFEGLLVFNRESSLFSNVSHSSKILTHQLMNIGAFIFALIGFLVIYYNKNLNNKNHFTTWHGTLGLATVCYVPLQMMGGAIAKYPALRNILKMKLSTIKLYHATSGSIVLTLASCTLLTAFYSSWFTQQVGDIIWWICFACLAVIPMIGLNQITSAYLPRSCRKPAAEGKAEENSGTNKIKKRTTKAKQT
ncbi:hypothetical protein CHS0354_033050 [Potamilus streckersoni]|uniref:ascorbate ferrireductase (transmembrane) n=1 Tax=Potamilus streckersoni TaxID=2493646 RepID=A0AAE0VLP5_9BIVA|nr:hypothetical protein CHS0354_033050 [Potamilus streckersoni]